MKFLKYDDTSNNTEIIKYFCLLFIGFKEKKKRCLFFNIRDDDKESLNNYTKNDRN